MFTRNRKTGKLWYILEPHVRIMTQIVEYIVIIYNSVHKTFMGRCIQQNTAVQNNCWYRVVTLSERALWRDVFNIAVQYRRLVDPEQPVLWLDLMTPPDNENYRTEFSFIR